jgi:hypothetical protein
LSLLIEGEGNDKDMDGPLYSDMLRMGLDCEGEERRHMKINELALLVL